MFIEVKSRPNTALLHSTQGTTGNPKGATLSHHGIVNNAFLTGSIIKYEKVLLS